MLKMILVRGLPGSGKSTMAREIAAGSNFRGPGMGYAHLEADQFFYENGVYNFDASKLHQAHQRCLLNARTCLEGNQSCVVSNTFTTKKELKPYFDLALEFNIAPVVLLAQNVFGSVHGVPDETMKKMQERFQFDIYDMIMEQTFKLIAKNDGKKALEIFVEALSRTKSC